jgi:ferredoxin
MITSEQVKKYARECGADIVGVAAMDRFEGAPRQMDPRYILPGARSAIVMGFRHFRGVFRGIEEGTFFTAYSAMGYAGINYIYQPLVLWHVGKMLEDEGYDALPVPNNFPWGNTNGSGQNPELTGKMNPAVSRPVSPEKPAPDVFPHLRIAAFCAGLGEIGYGKVFLSPQFGPRQRLAMLMTTAPLQPDPLFPGGLCDRCMECVKACTAGAIPRHRTVKVTVAGRDLEWADIDMVKCSVGFCGGNKHFNPFAVTPEDEAGFAQEVGRAQQYKLPPMYNYARALEGAAGCLRACMIHLEQQGKLHNAFRSEFRRRKPWRL